MIAPARCIGPIGWRICRRADGYTMILHEAGHYLGVLLVAMLLLLPQLAAQAAGAGPATKEQDATPPKVHELLDILADPAVQTWLARQRAGAAANTEPAPASEEGTVAGHFAGRVAAIREHMAALAAAAPQLPAEFERAGATLFAELQDRGLIEVSLLLVGFVALGFGAEWLLWRATAGFRRHIAELPLVTAVDRLQVAVGRLALAAGHVIVFALGSVGAFLAFDWPPIFRDVILGYLLAFLALRLTLVLGRFLLAPGGPELADVDHIRIVPMSKEAARFWYQRIGLAVGWFAFGWVTVSLLGKLGVSLPARQLVAYVLGFVLLLIGLDIAWRRPRAPADGSTAATGRRRLGHTGRSWLLSLYFVALWLLWVASAMPAFWLAVLIIGLPALIGVTQRSVEHVLRPTGTVDAGSGVPSVLIVSIERGARAVLLIGAALLLAHAWAVDLGDLAARDTLATRILRGGFSASVILLLADFAWQLIKAVIDGKLAETKDLGPPNTDEARRRARIQTLLPVGRNVILITLIVVSAMMALSALGVEIGPLIAGAGVIGVALGFGAQTLVRDIISGMFYFIDDAFRVGEYIQSGTYKGTVESFSLRSVKLRHHRGPLYTVPFGVLGAVQNMSRDWVIDKMTVGVTYDTDLERVKKLIKQIGKELAEDPEFAPHILEPLKMQGVEQFGDFAIQIRMKMMTRPGEQFVIRRCAYAMIKKAFDANGIKIAFPTVQVAGGDEGSAAAAHAGLELVKPSVSPAA
jgi:moderate conductance mechanosensitive channel